MKITLRDYQQKAIESVFTYLKKYRGLFPLLVLPTGGGKTIVFSELIRRVFEMTPKARVLVLAHRKELIEQAEQKLLFVWPAAPVGVFSASLRRRELKPITIASRDTIKNHLDKIGTFDLVIIDEAHNISLREDSSYRTIIDNLRGKNDRLAVLGVTATPYRMTDGKIYGDGALFSDICFELKIKELIDKGYLCRIKAKAIHQGEIDTSNIKSSNGDFRREELSKAAARSDLVINAVNEWRDFAIQKERRKLSIFFCVSLEHAALVREILLMNGFDFPIIDGKTPQGKRTKILKDAEALRIGGVINVGVLTEGTDIPPIDCIVMLRPTKSLGLYIQMVGRGLRLSPETGKENCLLLDFGGCLDRFGPIDIAQPPERGQKDSRTKVCEECDSVVGFYARRCPECGYQFMPQPIKLCPDCGTENAPSAASCSACSFVFVTHEETASSGRVLSDDLPLEKMPVDSVSCHSATKNGNAYVRVFFENGIRFATKHLFIGYPGLAGKQAIEDWQSLTLPGTPIPRNAFEAIRLSKQNEIFRAIESVIVDPAEQFKSVRSIQFKG